jgi:hypothetical protein
VRSSDAEVWVDDHPAEGLPRAILPKPGLTKIFTRANALRKVNDANLLLVGIHP